MISELGASFDIQYPDFYNDMNEEVGKINVEPSKLMPLECIFPFAATYLFQLVTKTAVTTALVVVFAFTSTGRRRNPDETSPCFQPYVQLLRGLLLLLLLPPRQLLSL